eukprot:TRINITY_DN4181_c1_g2_i1.p1 TRINITY_DN4181_c1_g2~~TRINITY_DN4181_c1_g2_i1.p1  ORF type:complete len:1134 (-),score=374.42 TRINITY_DN4181_c1_g2_i1:193-3594(-)
MFLLPPPQTGDLNSTVVTYFGDPVKLKEGVFVREKDNAKGKRIYSVYDLEPGVKYIHDHGFTLKRISEHECVVKRRRHVTPLSIPDVPRQSSPISIPSSFAPPKVARTLESSSSSRSETEIEDRIARHIGESFDQHAAAKGLSPFEDIRSSPFEEIDFMPHSRSVDLDDDHDADSDGVRIAALPTPYIAGETLEGRFDDVEYISTAGSGAQPANRDAKHTAGALYITNYQLIFVPYEHHRRLKRVDSSDSLLARKANARPHHEKPVSIPLAAIARFEKVDRQNNHFMFGGDTSYSIDIFAKDFRRTMRFALNPGKHSRPEVCNLLSRYVFAVSLNNVFAVSQNRPAVANAGDGLARHPALGDHAASSARVLLLPGGPNGATFSGLLEYGDRLSYHGPAHGFSSMILPDRVVSASGPESSGGGPVGPSNSPHSTPDAVPISGARTDDAPVPGAVAIPGARTDALSVHVDSVLPVLGALSIPGARTDANRSDGMYASPKGLPAVPHFPSSPSRSASVGPGSHQGAGVNPLNGHHASGPVPSGRTLMSVSAASVDFGRPASESCGLPRTHIRCASSDSVFISAASPALPGPPTAPNTVLEPYPPSPALLGPDAINGWTFYSPEEEYGRMGVGDSRCPWRFSHANSSYKLCKSYPKTFVVPAAITDEELTEVSLFRSKERIPVLSWRNRNTGVSLSRCSQPKTGMSRSYRCRADEKLVSQIQLSNPNSREVHIMDARPMANAMANMAMGGGYENLNFYPECELDWMGIANIHVVRDSCTKLREVCELYTAASYADCDPLKAGSGWLSALEGTHWFENLSSILGGVVRVVDLLEKRRKSVLVHCSDGWDRTPQVCSLVQLFIDPYYRTLRGFCCLVEKEWLQFGHKFAERLGFNFEDTIFKADERSPIFLQFLDCAYQALVQFPHKFEFSEQLLLTIMEHAYSGRFGTFLKNDQRERTDTRLHELTPSLWSYILNNPSPYLNPFYQPDTHSGSNVIVPMVDIKNLQLWRGMYLRYMTDHTPEFDNHCLRIGTDLKRQVTSLEAETAALKQRNADLLKQLQTLQTQQQALAASRHASRSASLEYHGEGDHDQSAVSKDTVSGASTDALLGSDWVSMEDDEKCDSPPAVRVFAAAAEQPG